MCGIWGYVGRDEPIRVEKAWDGLCALTDRGPDSWGMYIEGNGRVTNRESFSTDSSEVAIGNRRLSILDPSPAGTQPMKFDSSWIIYNGEVYNYREIREDLREAGHKFTSDTDTEVILHSYAEYGSECVEQLRGMFSFAIYNTESQQLFAARDRFGIKPFYYSWSDDRFAFASEVTSLLDGDVVDRVLDPTSVDGFLTFGYVPGSRTIIDGLQSLPPASTLTYDRSTGELKVKQYWDPSFDSPNRDENLRNLIEQSISLRLRSDVPVGAFLSGGLDSSTIVAMMRELSADDHGCLHTFSVGFESENFDESKFAETIAERFNTDHTSKVIRPGDIREYLDDIIRSMDQPTIDGVNTYFVSQAAASEGIKVTLSGVGSDELFFGYPTFNSISKRYRAARALHTIPQTIRESGGKLISHMSGIINSATIEAASDAVSAKTAFGAAYLSSRGLFSQQARGRLLPRTNRVKWDEQISESIASQLGTTDIRNVVSQTELSWYMRDQLLKQTDVMSMAHSLEVRVPFLDTQLAEHVFAQPPEEKTRGEKGILKETVSDLLPLDVIEREKTGFTFPFAKWLRGDLHDIVEEALSKNQLSQTPIDTDAAAVIRSQFMSGERHWSRVWALTILSLWINEHLYENEQ